MSKYCLDHALMMSRTGVTLPGSWGVKGEYLVMEMTVGMFAQICLLMLSTSAASLTLLDWHLSRKTVRADRG